MRRALLDINVLIALLDLDHVHHRRARSWLLREIVSGWASCPLTENGCIRIMSGGQARTEGPEQAEYMLRARRFDSDDR